MAEGRVIWQISCDESGTHGARYYGFGSLWMSWQRRGDFSAAIAQIREKHGITDEIKWGKTAYRTIHFYKDLLEFFFKTKWLVFHCLVVQKSAVQKELHEGDFDLARRKHFTEFLAAKISASMSKYVKRDVAYRIVADPIASRYAKAAEVVEIIANNKVRGRKGRAPIESVVERDSKDVVQIQLCDLMLGAVLEAWQTDAVSDHKQSLQKFLAEHIGWEDLRADTFPDAKKFNVWFLWDGPNRPRRVRSRDLTLKYPID